MAAEILPAGKLRPETLTKLLRHTSQAQELVVGPAVGEDAAVIDQGNQYLVVTTDPITFATERCGWYSVCVNANDIAACGGTPRYYSAAIVLPEGQTSLVDVELLFAEIEDACREIGVLWIGGHTEISPTVNTVLVAGQMIGEVTPEYLCRSSDARVGDALVLVKAAAIEATAIIAVEKAEEVAAVQGEERLKRSQNFLLDPGISVVREAALAREFPVNAMHDPTEGGLANGVHELCDASGVGFELENDNIPMHDATKVICNHLQINPLELISSGCMIISCDSTHAPDVVKELNAAGIDATIIGTLHHNPTHRKIIIDSVANDLKRPSTDALWSALKKINPS